jgi:Eco57I restriction-modification methylase
MRWSRSSRDFLSCLLVRVARSMSKTVDLIHHLASRPGHDEVKAVFRALLIEEFGVEIGVLEFERRVPEVRGRLDALIGRTVFEAKSDLDREWNDVLRRMPDYLADREREEGENFIGVASDGRNWAVFERDGERLIKLKEFVLDPSEPDRFLAFLDGSLALKSSLPPDPQTIRIELGQDSIAFHRASKELIGLWTRLKDDPSVMLKRQLWSSLLKLVYGRELETDALWIQHTYLVVVAKALALAVLDVRDDDPKRVLSGASFEAIGILGAVDSDFFDWVVETPEGEALVRRILNHVRRFRLHEVKTDVLKVLYESLIDRTERHGLGEYYTPDWLAAKIVREAVDRPLEQRVLDPACGSGTFLFHAVRHFLSEAEEAGLPLPSQASEAAAHVAGMDIHPVAVIIARVTFLLALAPVLRSRHGGIAIPVYLGDSMQLSITSMFAGKELSISVPPRRDALDDNVARNLSRPLAFSAGKGWANVVVGNPPWVAYRHMSADLQKRYKEMAKDEKVYVGGKLATQNDLSALFLARCTELYLGASGRLAFVMPLAALTRGQFERLRRGSFHSTRLQFEQVWTMDESVVPLFPVPSCVLFARKRATARAVPKRVRAYSGELPYRDCPEEEADAHLNVNDDAPIPDEVTFKGGSPYRNLFRQGATLVPRMLCLIERDTMGGILGTDPSRPLVRSRRNNQEKRPWKLLDGVRTSVEAQFIRPVLLGESIVPFRVSRSFEGIIPASDNGTIYDAKAAAAQGYSGLFEWMTGAEKIWNDNRPSPISLVQQFDYYGKLAAQFPISSLRVLYAASGTIPAACIARDTRSVIEHGVYWRGCASDAEAYYLSCILNSEVVRSLAASKQARGQWGARHFDKVVFGLPIPFFDVACDLHRELADLGTEAEAIANSLTLPPDLQFQRARKAIRSLLDDQGTFRAIEVLVAALLGVSEHA